MNGRRKKLFFAILAITLSTVASLCAAEWALRLTVAQNEIIPDPVLENMHVPGGFGSQYDSRGFRNPQALTAADIVALGDSQTEGNNATTSDQAWPLVLGSVASTTVYSMSVEGWGPVQYAALTPTALTLQPKLLIVGFYFGNDLSDAERVTYELDAWKQLRDAAYMPPKAATSAPAVDRAVLGTGVEPGSFQYWALEIRMWIRSHSMLYALAGNATRGFREWIGVASTFDQKQDALRSLGAEHPDLVYVYNANPLFETVLSPSYRFQTVNLKDSQTAEGWRITRGLFLDMQKESLAAGTKLILMLIPTKEKVYLEYMKAENQKVPESFAAYDAAETDMFREVNGFCLQQEITCFSPLADMVSAMQSGTDLYGNTMDGHPLPPGYRVIGESAANFLIHSGLLPTSN